MKLANERGGDGALLHVSIQFCKFNYERLAKFLRHVFGWFTIGLVSNMKDYELSDPAFSRGASASVVYIDPAGSN